MNPEKDWKIKLRNGKLKTPYRHYTAITEGDIAGELGGGFTCRPGSALMAVKAWASSSQQCADMVAAIGKQIGFAVTGRIQIYETEPSQPPEDVPIGYDLNFTPVDDAAEMESDSRAGEEA